MGYETYTELITVPTPAAGAGAVFVIPSDWHLTPYTVRAQLATSAAVANRVPFLSYQDGDGNTFADFNSGQTIAASGSEFITWAGPRGASINTGTARVTAGLASIRLRSGYRIAINADLIDAGDQISSVVIFGRKHPTGEMGEPRGAEPYSPEEILLP